MLDPAHRIVLLERRITNYVRTMTAFTRAGHGGTAAEHIAVRQRMAERELALLLGQQAQAGGGIPTRDSTAA